MSAVNERCAQVMAQVMKIDPSDVGDDASPETLDQWDSLSHVQLVLALEKEFDIKISPEEGIEHFVDFKSICEYISEKTA